MAETVKHTPGRLVELAPELLEFLSALASYNVTPAREFRKRFPDFAKAMSECEDSGQRIHVICNFAFEIVAKVEERT